jgi:hypothetical protein
MALGFMKEESGLIQMGCDKIKGNETSRGGISLALILVWNKNKFVVEK